MASAQQLTGGTGDVNMQPLKLRAKVDASTSVSTWARATTSVAIPVQRLPNGRKAQVMEILGIQFNAFSETAAQGALTLGTTGSQAHSLAVCTRSYGTNAITYGNSDPYVLYYEECNMVQCGPNRIIRPETVVRTFNDQAGHGLLFGGDNIYVQAGVLTGTTNPPTAHTHYIDITIWYRWKNVSFTEYVGMVIGT